MALDQGQSFARPSKVETPDTGCDALNEYQEHDVVKILDLFGELPSIARPMDSSFPSLVQLRAAISAEGIALQTLGEISRDRVGTRKVEFAAMVRETAVVMPDKMVSLWRVPISRKRESTASTDEGQDKENIPPGKPKKQNIYRQSSCKRRRYELLSTNSRNTRGTELSR